MSYKKTDLINYRLDKSLATFEEAKSLSQLGFWGGAANRLYYSCFYAVTALLAKDDIAAQHITEKERSFLNLISRQEGCTRGIAAYTRI